MTTDAYGKINCYSRDGMLLHGSPNKFEILQGKPLCATNVSFLAILYAVKPHLKDLEYCKWSPFGEIRATERFIKNMGPGYVYAVNRNQFRVGKVGEAEYITYESVTPAACIEVTPEDLPRQVVRCSASEEKSLKKIFGCQLMKNGFRNRTSMGRSLPSRNDR